MSQQGNAVSSPIGSGQTGQVTFWLAGPYYQNGNDNFTWNNSNNILTVNGSILGSNFSATGLTGAVSGTRLVGATAGGAPLIGTFIIGDFIIDRTGTIWICTSNGTPGTWEALAQNSNVVPNTRTITSGAGLTGGGNLSADRTLDIVAADSSITVNADSIQVGVISDTQHGSRAGGILHPTATEAVAGFMSATDKKRMSQAYDAFADFGFVGDLVTVFDGACSTGANTKITSATANFSTQAFINMRVTLNSAGSSNAKYVGTITNIDSNTQITVSPAITTSVTNKCLQFGTDNTSAITTMVNTINNTTFPGAKIIFGRSTTNAYGFPIRAVFNKSVQIEGQGGGHTTDVGDYTRTGGTRLAWWGSSNDGGTNFGAFFEFSPTGTQSLKRVAMRHCWLDCRNGDQNQILYGIKLASCHGFMLDDFFVMDALAQAIWTDIDSNPTEAKDTTRFNISNFCIRQLDNTSVGMTTTTGVQTLPTATINVTSTSGFSTNGSCIIVTTNGNQTVTYTGITGTTLTGCSGGTGNTSNGGLVTALANTTPTTTSSAITLSTSGQSLTLALASVGTAAEGSGYAWVASNLGYPVLIKYSGGGGTTTLTGCVTASEFTINAPATVSGSNVVGCTPGNAGGFLFSGGTGANSCCGMVSMGQISHGSTWGPAGIECNNADSIIFAQIMQNQTIGGGAGTNDGAINRIRKPGVRLNGSNTSATLASRNNIFLDGDASVGGVSAMGVLNTGTRLLAMSGPNYWDRYQLGNSAAIPNIEGNAYFEWSPNGGFRTTQQGQAAITDQAIAAATNTLINGSLIVVPPQGFQIGTIFRWTINGVTSAAAGTGTNTITIRYGTTGLIGDAAIATFTTTAGTGVTAMGFRILIEMTIRTLGAGGTGVANCQVISHNNTGFTGSPNDIDAAVSLNTTTVSPFLSIGLTTGALKTVNIRQCITEVINSGNP